MEKTPDLKVQKQILDLISNNPGLYISKIADVLNIRISEVEEYLNYLKKKKVINIVYEEGYDRYFIAERKGNLKERRMTDIRKRMYDLIYKNPGFHLSKIAEMLNMRTSLAEYHLNYLEKNNEIIAIKDESSYYKRYYTESSLLNDRDRQVLSLLRQKIPLQITIYLLKNPKSRHKDLLDNLGLTTSTLTYHLHKLVDYEIVVAPKYGEKGYFIKNRKEIIGHLRRYKIYTMIECFKDAWGE